MKKWRYLPVVLIAFPMLFTRCHKETVDIENAPDLRLLSAGEREMVESSNEFALNLLKAVNQEKNNENVFISPLSVDFALNMVLNGAMGETRDVMKQTLGSGHLSDEEANAAARDLTSLLLGMDRKVSLSIANAIWFEEGLTLRDSFRDHIEEYYDGKIEGLNFADPSSPDVISDWVEEKTRGKIKNLIKETQEGTAMLLVNAIYFNADWKYPFEQQRTKEEQFTLGDGSKVPVQMMFSRGVKLEHYINETLQLLSIPYGNGQFSMIILLPRPEKTTADVLSHLSGENLAYWMEQSDTLTPELFLPKFTMTCRIGLKDPLSAMGMGLAFSGNASFGGFFRESPGRNLSISKVVHQAVIEVDEVGSEAAAATAVEIITTSIGPDRRTIRVDRPFVFLIREKHSGVILFAGKLKDPS